MEWKTIEGFNNYQVNKNGEIRSLGRFIVTREGWKPYWKKGRTLKGSDNGNGYKKVVIKNDKGQQKQKYVHRLVAKTFIPNPNKKPQVNHLDGDKSNNKVSNLEWNTNSENNLHSYRELNRKTLKNNPKVCKPVYKLNKEGKILNEYPSTREAGRQNGITGVSAVCLGKRKTAGGYRWKFKEV